MLFPAWLVCVIYHRTPCVSSFVALTFLCVCHSEPWHPFAVKSDKPCLASILLKYTYLETHHLYICLAWHLEGISNLAVDPFAKGTVRKRQPLDEYDLMNLLPTIRSSFG